MKIPCSPKLSDLSAPENNLVVFNTLSTWEWCFMSLWVIPHQSMQSPKKGNPHLSRVQNCGMTDSEMLVMTMSWTTLTFKHHLNSKNLLRVLQGRADVLAEKHCFPQSALSGSRSIISGPQDALVQNSYPILFVQVSLLSCALLLLHQVKKTKNPPNRICEMSKGKHSSGSTVSPTTKLNYVPSSKDSFEEGM